MSVVRSRGTGSESVPQKAYGRSEPAGEIVAELGDQFFRPVRLGHKSTNEEAEHLRFLGEFEAADQFPILVEPFDAIFDVLDLGEGEDATRHGESEQFDFRGNVVPVCVTVHRDSTPFHPANAGNHIECSTERTGWVFELRYV